jgi:hypothetical protein
MPVEASLTASVKDADPACLSVLVAAEREEPSGWAMRPYWEMGLVMMDSLSDAYRTLLLVIIISIGRSV